jgi:predicted nucleic acid-binding protein
MIDLKDVIELHDKIIVATAKYLNASLITKDSALEKISYIRTVW